MRRSIYGIHGNDDVVFFDLEAAEDYVMKNYQEYITCKDQFIEYCEDMIWEYKVIRCWICEECDTDESLTESLNYWQRSNCGDFHKHSYCSL